MSDKRRMNLFVNECFNADRVKFAEITGISESAISRIVSEKNNMGIGVMGKIVAYCKENNIEYGKYIMF